jgi:hypothetical protein
LTIFWTSPLPLVFEYAARLPPERPTSTPTDLVLPKKLIGVPDAELPKKILDCVMDYCVQRPKTTMVIVYVMSEIYMIVQAPDYGWSTRRTAVDA